MAALLISIAIDGRPKEKDRNCLDCQELESFGLEEIADLAFSYHFFPEKDNSIVERYDLLIADKEEFGQLIPLEQGKLLKEAIGEVSYGASFIEFFAEEAKFVFGDIILATLRQALESEAVMGRFHAVYDKLNQALDDVSYDELGISVEVKEQVELMCMQLKRAKRRTDTQDIEPAMDLMVVFSEDDRNADSAVLERLALELHTKADLKAEPLAVRKLVKERGGQNANSIQQIIDLLANHPANQQIKAGIIPSLLHLLEDKSLGMVDEALSILQLLVSHPEACNEIGRLLFVETLVEIITNGTPKNKECAKSVLLELGLNNSSCILAAVQFGVYEHLIEMTPFCSS